MGTQAATSLQSRHRHVPFTHAFIASIHTLQDCKHTLIDIVVRLSSLNLTLRLTNHIALVQRDSCVELRRVDVRAITSQPTYAKIAVVMTIVETAASAVEEIVSAGEVEEALIAAAIDSSSFCSHRQQQFLQKHQAHA